MTSHGENIRKRVDGRWEGRYPICSEKTGQKIYHSVYGRTYDERTAKLYRLDLERLSSEKNRRPSTISRKQRVFGCYLSHLAAQGIIDGARPLKKT